MILLTSDWHLDDNPQNEYRWRAFDALDDWMFEGADHTRIFHLGDICDRKDRHSAELVNRLITKFKALADKGAVIYILMGNHDKPLRGTPYWQFLDSLSEYLTFITKPHALEDLLLLPYSSDPASDWANIPFNHYRAALIHQTISGAKGNNGYILDNDKMPEFPRKLKVYSGDIHTTQVVKRVKYVGAPHPVAFGDSYPCQMLELNDDYTLARTIPLISIQKLMLRIDTTKDLERVLTRPGDQARIICKLALADIEKWSAMQDWMLAWAEHYQVRLFSIEPEIEGTRAADNAADIAPENDPEYILRLFADAEDINDAMFNAGLELLRETIG